MNHCDKLLPKNRGCQPLAALAVSGPFSAVKEQSSGLYANIMAERGFAALAFNPSYTGESGGFCVPASQLIRRSGTGRSDPAKKSASAASAVYSHTILGYPDKVGNI